MKTALKTFTKTKKEELGEGGLYPDEQVLSLFADYAYDQNYPQILFEFGKQYLELLLAFHENRSEYEVCGTIIKEVRKYNKNKNTNIKLISWNLRK